MAVKRVKMTAKIAGIIKAHIVTESLLETIENEIASAPSLDNSITVILSLEEVQELKDAEMEEFGDSGRITEEVL